MSAVDALASFPHRFDAPTALPRSHASSIGNSHHLARAEARARIPMKALLIFGHRRAAPRTPREAAFSKHHLAPCRGVQLACRISPCLSELTQQLSPSCCAHPSTPGSGDNCQTRSNLQGDPSRSEFSCSHSSTRMHRRCEIPLMFDRWLCLWMACRNCRVMRHRLARRRDCMLDCEGPWARDFDPAHVSSWGMPSMASSCK